MPSPSPNASAGEAAAASANASAPAASSRSASPVSNSQLQAQVPAFDLVGIKPTPNAIRVANLSSTATEKAVIEFFAFCGTVDKFQMLDSPIVPGTKEALIVFDRESAANTALLLTNAIIVDRSIIVRPFFQAHEVTDPLETVDSNERAAASGKLEGHKPLTRVVAELLAAGYTVTEPVLRKSSELNQKYGLSSSLASLLANAQARAAEIDGKLGISSKIKDIDARLHISENASAALAAASGLGERALNSSAGQVVAGTVANARDKALAVASETKNIVESRRAGTGNSSPASQPISPVATPVPAAEAS